MRYRVIADNFTRAPEGATVTDDDLDGLNVKALIQCGTIRPMPKPKKTEEVND